MDKPKQRIALALVGLLALVFAVFWPALSADFIYLDDTAHIVSNPIVTGGVTWDALSRAFQPYSSLWTPLTWISHMVVVEFAGMDATWHHLVNVVLHSISVLLLFGWIFRLTRQFWVSLAVGAIFAVHPLNVENVVWVTERNHLLAMLFLLAGLHAYTSHVRQVDRDKAAKTSGWMRLTELAMLLSIMSKGVFLTFPVLLLILDAWPFRRLHSEALRRVFLEKCGLYAIALFSMFMTLSALDPRASSGDALSFLFRVCVALTTLGWQALRLLVPYELSPIHPLPPELLWPQALLSTAALILAAVIGWRSRNRQPWILAAVAWYVLSLLPVSGVTQAGNTFFSDRFVYLPQIGLFLAVSLSAALGLSRYRHGTTIGIAALSLLVITYGSISFWYTRMWKDTATLFTHAARVTENNFIAHTTAALALRRNKDLPGAAHHYEAGLRINPNAENFRNTYGDILVEMGRNVDAVAQFEGVLALDDKNPTARFKLATTQMQLGRAGEALRHFQLLKQRQVKAPNLDEWIRRAEAQAAREANPPAP